MAHFAEIDSNNTVIRVLVIPDEHEHRGQDYLATDLGLGGTWLQTSYNTKGGVHYGQDGHPDEGVAFRKNYAGPGMTYDVTRDAFIHPSPYPSWKLNETTCHWEAPTPMPTDGRIYEWVEADLNWQVVELPADPAAPTA